MNVLDALYANQIRTDFGNRNADIFVNKNGAHILSTTSLIHLICSRSSVPRQSMQSIRPRKYTKTLRNFITIDSENKTDFFEECQLILAVNKNIPLHLTKPSRIYCNNHMYKGSGRSTRFECPAKDCKKAIEYVQQTNTFTSDPNQLHTEKCMNIMYKQQLINVLIKLEIYHNIRTDASISINIRNHYDRVKQRYLNQFPGMNLQLFPCFEYIASSLRKQKPKTLPLKSCDVTSYFHSDFNKTLMSFCPSRTQMLTLRNNLLYARQNESVLFSTKDLINVIGKGIAVGGDGTWNVTPMFAVPNTNRRRAIHEQVFKVYSFHKYESKDKAVIIKSYLVAVALLSDKAQTSYEWIFNNIKDWYLQHTLHTEPNNLNDYICDFEVAQRNAWQEICTPELNIYLSAEEFHHKKAIWNNAKKKGVKKYVTYRKNNQYYNKIVKQHMEMAYNLMYLPPQIVMQYALIIMRSLWNYCISIGLANKERRNFLDFILYFLYGWCECSKDMVRNELHLTTEFTHQIDDSHPTRISRICEWNGFKKPVTNSNSIEVNNRHDRVAMGFHPTINSFGQWCLHALHESNRRYVQHAAYGLPYCPKRRWIIEKKRIIQQITDNITFNQYAEICANLIYIKYEKNDDVMHKYFIVSSNAQRTRTMIMANITKYVAVSFRNAVTNTNIDESIGITSKKSESIEQIHETSNASSILVQNFSNLNNISPPYKSTHIMTSTTADIQSLEGVCRKTRNNPYSNSHKIVPIPTHFAQMATEQTATPILVDSQIDDATIPDQQQQQCRTRPSMITNFSTLQLPSLTDVRCVENTHKTGSKRRPRRRRPSIDSKITSLEKNRKRKKNYKKKEDNCIINTSGHTKRMQLICKQLGIQMHIKIKIYGFKNHLDVYECILMLLKQTAKQRRQYVKELTSAKMRDLKAKLRSEGTYGRKKEMMKGLLKTMKLLHKKQLCNNI